MKKLLAAVLFLPAIASAEFLDGNKLLSYMRSADIAEKMYALGYVAGVADAQMSVVSCPPENVTNGQLRDMVKGFLEGYPAHRHRTADTIIGELMKTAWPCRRNTL